MKEKRAFTLIELLVVIAIIALLMGIIVAALMQAKEAVKRVRCRNRLKQWGIAVQMYTTDNNDKIMSLVKYWGDMHIEWRLIEAQPNLPTMGNRQVEEWNGTATGWMGTSDTSYF